MTLSQTGITEFCNRVEAASGLAYTPEKAYLFEARLQSVIAAKSVANYLDLCALMDSSPAIRREILEALVTCETYFFRDEEAFRCLLDLIPRPTATKGPLTIWSVGCSTGQEGYSLLLTLAEAGWKPQQIELIGFDLSTRALAQAQEGRYSDFETCRGLPESLRARYFEPVDGGWQIQLPWRAVPRWLSANVLEGLPSGLPTPHVVFCRNLLVYFRQPIKDRVVAELTRRLSSEGLLVLARSDTAGQGDKQLEALPGVPANFYRKRPATVSP